MRATCAASFFGSLSSLAAAARRSSSSGNRRPQEEAQAAGHLPVVERDLGAARRRFDPVEERRRHQHARQRGADGALVRELPGRARRAIEAAQAGLLAGGERTAPGAAGERQHVVDVPGLRQLHRRHGRVVVRAQLLHVRLQPPPAARRSAPASCRRSCGCPSSRRSGRAACRGRRRGTATSRTDPSRRARARRDRRRRPCSS